MIQLLPIDPPACERCGARATRQLVNGPMLLGYFCVPCGLAARHDALQQTEEDV